MVSNNSDVSASEMKPRAILCSTIAIDDPDGAPEKNCPVVMATPAAIPSPEIGSNTRPNGLAYPEVRLCFAFD